MRVEARTLLSSLSERRPLFHSEADFQHSLAWEIQKSHPEAQVRLEVPLSGIAGRAALDIVVRLGTSVYAFELKYFKGALRTAHDGETFRLPATVARDISRYDACKDVGRLEHAVGSGQACRGFFIALSNDPGFWLSSERQGSIDEAFKIHDGRTLSGELRWTERAGAGTTKGRESAIELCGHYPLQWIEYSQIACSGCGRFRCLVVDVESGKAPTPSPDPTLRAAAPEAKSAIGSGSSTGKDGLREFLRSAMGTSVELSFAEVEAFLGTLPNSARVHRAWWSGVKSHPHAIWEHEGYRARPDLALERVCFLKV